MATEAFENEVFLQSYAYNTWVYTAKTAEGETLDMVVQPTFWANLSRKAKARDVIEVIADDLSFEFRGRVFKVAPGEVHIRTLSRVEGDLPKVQGAGFGYEIEWAGPVHKHRVVRVARDKPDAKEVLQYGFSDKPSAETWLEAHLASPSKAAA